MPKLDPRTIDKRLEYALTVSRKAKGLTQVQLAIRLKKPQSFVSKYETGELKLTVGNFIYICKTIGVNPEEILSKIGG
jgi:transcriptional regulator with XRE-family HTH domain